MSLNCVGPLTWGFFSVVNTTIPRDTGLVESVDVELQIRRHRGCGACMYVRSCVLLCVTLWTIARRLLSPWGSPGKNTGVDCHLLLPGVFLTQGSNPVSLALAGGLYTTVPPGKLCVYGGIIIIYTQVFNCVEGQCPQTPYCSGVNSTSLLESFKIKIPSPVAVSISSKAFRVDSPTATTSVYPK